MNQKINIYVHAVHKVSNKKKIIPINIDLILLLYN